MDQIMLYLSVLTIILLLVLIFRTRNARPPQPEASPVIQAVSAPGISPEVVAAITAAVAVMMEGSQGFTVKHIKRIHSAPAWNRAGREEQIYSRL